MVKLIELNPEWILKEIPKWYLHDSYSNIILVTDSIIGAKLIKLAFSTLCCQFEEIEYMKDDREIFEFVFRIDDIRENCPNLYNLVKEFISDPLKDKSWYEKSGYLLDYLGYLEYLIEKNENAEDKLHSKANILLNLIDRNAFEYITNIIRTEKMKLEEEILEITAEYESHSMNRIKHEEIL